MHLIKKLERFEKEIDHLHAGSLISGISGAIPKFSEINFEIVPKIRKFVACAGRFGFDLIHSNACEKLM